MDAVEPDAAITEGLAAWVRGDLAALERVLHPDVTLRAIQPGPWDCDDRDQVMRLLRLRQEQRGGDPPPTAEVKRLDESTYLASGLGGPDGVATLVKVSAGKVMSLQQIPTRSDPNAAAAVTALRSGDTSALRDVLAQAPELAHDPVPGYQGRTLLHIATDWPGYLPNAPEVVRLLVEHGADPNHRGGDNVAGETPLHWAASSDDVDVARALLDVGADPEAPGGSIGTPLDNAIGYACWNVARLLVARGAKVDKLWHAGALGLLDRLEELLADNSLATSENINQAFWYACGASQRRAAELLLDRGADLNWVPDYADGTALDAAHGSGTRQNNVIEWLESRGARSSESTEGDAT
jgi:hypothetical protein